MAFLCLSLRITGPHIPLERPWEIIVLALSVRRASGSLGPWVRKGAIVWQCLPPCRLFHKEVLLVVSQGKPPFQVDKYQDVIFIAVGNAYSEAENPAYPIFLPVSIS